MKNGHTHNLAVQVATGQISQSEFAEKLNVNPATVSRNIATYYRDAIKDMQGQCNKMQDQCNDLQRECNALQDQCNAMQDEYNALQLKHNALQSDVDRWQGQPRIIQLLASSNASTAMLFLLAAFEGVGSFHLLQYKGVALALPVSVAIAFALLHFTAKQNTFGKLFCIAFALVVGGIYFDVFPGYISSYLFAFVPPIIAGLIAMQFKIKKHG